MPTDVLLVIIDVVAIFVTFAAALAWQAGSIRTRSAEVPEITVAFWRDSWG